MDLIPSKFDYLQSHISPSYLLDRPYRDILIAIAQGDGKLHNISKRAKQSEAVCSELILQLVELDILQIENSRENPLRLHPKQKIKRSLRSYRIEPKVRFQIPFLRFWFGFVEPYRDRLLSGDSQRFIENYNSHYDRCVSLVFEQLSDDLLELHFGGEDTIISRGSFWDHHSEFDILSITKRGDIILGECKYKDRRVCKNELNKLKEKAKNSGIVVDTYALFSKDGFSNELKYTKDKNLLLFDLSDFKKLQL
ncbi:hypothetical protein MNB_SV-6-96 [hydrothermal vent metagenome]|uniref:DUF234 domain-containing protein n=1 Tax=hydrothermal vent metagenome TaxID=652676 RepID=A0A1W1BKJ6_9ZZZZ